jgi:hypothetical protein
MKSVGRTAVCTLFFLVTLGAALAQQVKTDFDHQVNFSQFKTYPWQEIKPANSLWDARIKNAVDAQLTAKGWTQVDRGVDVAIAAIKTTHTERTLQTFYDGMGGGWRWRGFGGTGEATTTEQDYKEGTRLVGMYNTKTKQLIWPGSDILNRGELVAVVGFPVGVAGHGGEVTAHRLRPPGLPPRY